MPVARSNSSLPFIFAKTLNSTLMQAGGCLGTHRADFSRRIPLLDQCAKGLRLSRLDAATGATVTMITSTGVKEQQNSVYSCWAIDDWVTRGEEIF